MTESWTFGWEALVAIGTLLLALATALLAWSTRSLADETEESVKHSAELAKEAREQVKQAELLAGEARQQTEIAQLTLNAQVRPVLIDVPLNLGGEEQVFYPGRSEPVTLPRGGVHVFSSPDLIMIGAPLRNAGSGLAMIRGARLNVGAATPPVEVYIRPANVPPGERGRLSFAASRDNSSFDAIKEAIERGNLSVEVGYTDLVGQQYTVTRFDLYFRSSAHTNWEVRQVFFQEPGSDEPFAGSAPTS